MSQRHKASMFSCTFCTVPQIWGHCLQNSFTWRRCWSSNTLEPDSLLYFKQFWGIHRVASATVRTLWFQTHKRHFNPGKRNLTVPIQPQPNVSHQTHNGSQLPVRAHTCCASRLLEPQNWSWSSRAYSREGPLRATLNRFFYRVYIYIYNLCNKSYICIYMYLHFFCKLLTESMAQSGSLWSA